VDTFPYAGTTTTCEALYMGVPVITYHKRHPSLHAHNVGVTLLARIGSQEEGGGVGKMLIAESEAQFVELAVKLASDVPALQQLRASMRERMLQSPICQGKAFVEDLEKAYRGAWEAWCDKK
jgi:protein O-GlcNAc transferase